MRGLKETLLPSQRTRAANKKFFFATRVEMRSGKEPDREKGPSAAKLRCDGAAAGSRKYGIERAPRDVKANTLFVTIGFCKIHSAT